MARTPQINLANSWLQPGYVHFEHCLFDANPISSEKPWICYKCYLGRLTQIISKTGKLAQI